MPYVRVKCDEHNCMSEWEYLCSLCANEVCEKHSHVAVCTDKSCTYVCNACYQLCMGAYKLKQQYKVITTKDQYLSSIQDMIHILRALAVYSKDHPDTNDGLLAIAHGMQHEATVIIRTLTKTTETTGE